MLLAHSFIMHIQYLHYGSVFFESGMVVSLVWTVLAVMYVFMCRVVLQSVLCT